MSGLPLDAGEHSFSVLAAHLGQFVDAWETETAPAIVDYLPTEQSLRRMVLVELIKVDLEYRWGEFPLPRHLEDYIAEFDELAPEELPVDLIYEEYHIRRQSGDNVTAKEYLERFPNHADALQRMLGVSSVSESTRLQAREMQEVHSLSIDDRIGDFDLLTELGQGAFARVFLARQESMQRLVALKVSANRGTEPQTLAQLDHEGIVRVYDVRDLPERSLRLLYMQYLPGGTLQAIVRAVRETPEKDRSGRMFLSVVDQALDARGAERPSGSLIRMRLASYDWHATVCFIGAVLARGLAYAHRRGILHRDIKPANILLSAEALPKLADFNISFSSQSVGTTPAAYFGGSLAYMSPEQLSACHPLRDATPEQLDERADIYSLAVVLWELTVGMRPFGEETTGADWNATLDRMIEARSHPVRENDLPATCPNGLVRVLCQALDPDPRKRPGDGEAFARALDLSLHPRAERLLLPRESRLRRWLLRNMIWVTIILCGVVPNGLAGWFNEVYNHRQIIDFLPANVQQMFDRVVLVINAVAFPVGMTLCVWLLWPVASWIRRRRRSGTTTGPPADSAIRRRCLNYGYLAAMVCVSLWLVASPTYPLSLHLTTGEMEFRDSVHFVGSLVICGFIAASYPFFLASFLCLHYFYPVLRSEAASLPEDRSALKRLRSDSEFFLRLGLAPNFGVLALVLMNAQPSTQQEMEAALRAQAASSVNFALAVLAICGVLGFLLLYKLQSILRADVDALLEIEPDDFTTARLQ